MMQQKCAVAFTILILVGIAAGAGTYDRICAEPAVIFDEAGAMTAPEVSRKVDPKYPEEARKEGAMGTVILDAVINASGAVDNVTVLEDPDARLSAAAVDAVRQWRFEPATDKSGEPIAVCYVLTVKFHLK